ncbi:hypothetical protein ACIA8O_18525 [Kitasatospora sp. NPDC051853]|uniref:hypothetical protein n=1 Tax=Kitasatospora sp. NPDC051853 TaxID=3364058 RepID=UPI0037903638
MHTVDLVLVRPGAGPPGPDEASAVQDAIWAHAAPADGLEHVRALALPEGIGLVLFLRAASRARASVQAQLLLARVLSSAAHAGLTVASWL